MLVLLFTVIIDHAYAIFRNSLFTFPVMNIVLSSQPHAHAVTMPSNVEIKARLAGREQAIQAAGRLSGSTGSGQVMHVDFLMPTML